MPDLLDRFDVVREEVEAGGLVLSILRPRSAEDLIDERDYARDERLPYWADLWPSARVLAAALAERLLPGLRVLELGCGVGLPSALARALGADVLATDWYPEALDFARRNARAAAPGRTLRTMLVDWRQPPAALLAEGPFDLVVGADLLYEDRNGRALAALVPRLVGAEGEALIADPRRPGAAELLEPLRAAGWRHEAHERRHHGRLDETGPIVRLHRLRPPSGPVERVR